jgi:hypothetical protein
MRGANAGLGASGAAVANHCPFGGSDPEGGLLNTLMPTDISAKSGKTSYFLALRC